MINIKNGQPKKRLNFKEDQIIDNGSGTRKTPWLQPCGYPAKVRFLTNHTYLEKQRLGNHVCTHMRCERKQPSVGQLEQPPWLSGNTIQLQSILTKIPKQIIKFKPLSTWTPEPPNHLQTME